MMVQIILLIVMISVKLANAAGNECGHREATEPPGDRDAGRKAGCY